MEQKEGNVEERSQINKEYLKQYVEEEEEVEEAYEEGERVEEGSFGERINGISIMWKMKCRRKK